MKNIALAIFTIALLFAPFTELQAQTGKRISFARGATSAVVSGKLKGFQDKAVYVIKLKAGQTFSTEQIKSEASTQYITLSITDPSGEQVGDMDASCNNRFEIKPTVAGDYKIEVVQCQKADEWKGSFKFRVRAL